ncbi:hypothetical protein O181_056166 [Austropuccinia psidii MF-1]|uniref:Secreted protein n=1 Tax=Austropuccinia psidii MF-1 TaxID=1389203 RepID=A0A9Q3E5T6_9BASI|nr:hypothetical protein [Austropuccinia psidii MF-1]
MFLRKIAFPAFVIISSPSLVFSSLGPSIRPQHGGANNVPCWKGYAPVVNSTEKIECNTGKSVFHCIADNCSFATATPAYKYMFFSDCFYKNTTRYPWHIAVKSYLVNADTTISIVARDNTPFTCPPKNNEMRPICKGCKRMGNA